MAVYAVDAHCHADILCKKESRFPDKYMEIKCAGITWAYLEEISCWEYLPKYWDQLKALALDLTQKGVSFYYLIGIHPRSIPFDLEGWSEFPKLLKQEFEKHMKVPYCRGLGELGLDRGTDIEEKILIWQLDWAREFLPEDRVVGIHTPRKDKEYFSRKTLDLLQDYADLKDRILLDHITPDTWSLIQEAGYMCGMTLQEGKTSFSEFMDFIKQNSKDRSRNLIINSDGANSLSSPYLELLENAQDLDSQIKKRCILENAASFFNLNLF